MNLTVSLHVRGVDIIMGSVVINRRLSGGEETETKEGIVPATRISEEIA